VVSKSDSDAVLVIAAGITLDQAQKAEKKLKSEHGVNIRIMDPFTVKPIDKEAIIANAKECGGRILTVEDHYPEVSCKSGTDVMIL
jgi:transketolase